MKMKVKLFHQKESLRFSWLQKVQVFLPIRFKYFYLRFKYFPLFIYIKILKNLYIYTEII